MSSDYFSQRIKHTGTRLKELNSEIVSYERGEYSTGPISATPAGTDSRTLEKYGIMITQEIDQVWSMDVEDLTIRGQRIVPEIGDSISRANGEVYTVITNSEQTFRYTTSNRDRILVVCKRSVGRTPLPTPEFIE